MNKSSFTTKRKTAGSLFVFLAVFLATELAQNAAFATGFITPGSPRASSPFSQSISTDSTVIPILSMEANRSYACSLVGSSATSNLRIQGIIVPTGSSITAGNSECGAMTPRITTDSDDTTKGVGNDGSPDNRACFIVDVAGDYSFQLDTESSAPEDGYFSCVETTLYGGYNTNANPFNFLEVINTTNSSINFKVRATNFDGTVVIDNLSSSVGANNRVDIDIHTNAGANKFGSIMVMHDGPRGALKAFVSQYTGTASNLTMAASVPLTTREQDL